MNVEEMTIDEARMVWLTMLGSDWVDEQVIVDSPYKSPLDVASQILDMEGLIEFNLESQTMRMKLICKS